MVLVLCNACFFRLDMSKIRVVNELMGGELEGICVSWTCFHAAPYHKERCSSQSNETPFRLVLVPSLYGTDAFQLLRLRVWF